MSRQRQLTFLLLLLSSSHLYSQFTTQGGFTPTYLVQNVLVGSGLSTGPVTSTGGGTQFGKFKNGALAIGIDSGIVMTTSILPGNTNYVFNGPSSGTPPGAGTNVTTYPLLQAIVGTTINNVAALQFTFTPQSDTLKFNYVFASEEYNTYVNSSFNDAFGFFLTGPKPGGGNYVDQNVAIVPNTVNTPVSINNVNNGQTFGCGTGPCTNCNYFVDNLCPGNPAYNSFVFNAYTKKLTAVAPVVPCSTYTIKLAICNALDNSFNSAVFLQANSFSATGFQLAVNQNSVSGNDTLLNEGCGNAVLEITRLNNLNQPVTVPLTVSGTATNGTDYTQLPDSITFAAGQSSYFLTISPIFDLITEPDETITITINSTLACVTSSSSVTFLLKNYEPLTVDAGNDTIMTCTGGTLTAHIRGGVPGIRTSWNNGASTTHTYNIAPTSAAWYYVTVTDTCGNTATDSVYVDYWAPEFVGYSIAPPQPNSAIEGCGNATVTIYRTENIPLQKTYPVQISGTAINGTDYAPISASITFMAGDTSATVTVQPVYDMINEPLETFIISVTDTLCNGTLVPFSQTVNIKNLDPVQVDAGPDILMDCPHHAIDVVPVYTDGWQPYTYSWSTGSTMPSVNVFPGDTTTYYITVTDSCGYTYLDSMTINVAHDPVADFQFNNIIYCEPAEVFFYQMAIPVSGDTLFYQWNFNDGNSSSETDPSNIFQSYGDYPVTLVVTNQYNCMDSVTYTVEVKPIPTAVPMFTPQNPSTLNPEVTFWDESYPNIISWYWETGDGSTSASNSFTYDYPAPGEYNAYLQVVNQWGCSDSIYFTIIVEEETSIYLPNSFTPNGDGLNDVFYVYGTNWRDMEFRVFDRWGGEVFMSDNPDKGWNGKINNTGEYLMNGTYAYKLYVIDFYGKEYEYMGHINLIR